VVVLEKIGGVLNLSDNHQGYKTTFMNSKIERHTRMIRKLYPSFYHLIHYIFKDQWKTEHIVMEVGQVKETQRFEYGRTTQILHTIALWPEERALNNHITDYVRGYVHGLTL
jgi:hypothetical protein